MTGITSAGAQPVLLREREALVRQHLVVILGGEVRITNDQIQALSKEINERMASE